jgi:phosphatidylglycerophosphatase A
MADEHKTRWAWALGTFFGCGYGRPGPGTWGSVAAVLLWAAAARVVPVNQQWWVCLVAAAGVTLIGIAASNVVARESGLKDPQFVVIDEVAGQLLTLVGAAAAWKSLLAGLILFRIFDILKPPPVRQMERILPAGAGIMLDDIGAGIYGLLVLQFITRMHWL